jgi:hypothetical protein
MTVTVGAGGVGAPPGGPPNNNNFHQFTIAATAGGSSVFESLTAIGGGFGGSSVNGYTPGANGGNGGSGGGASGYGSGQVGGTGTAGQGNRGGNNGGAYYSGGGGGAGAAGADGANTPNGGAGVLNNILGGGRNYYWAGGGGGASYSSGVGGNGGAGGGGGGSSGGLGDTTGLNPARNAGEGGGGDWVGSPGGDGGISTGGGGGGGMHYNRNNRGGNGGSGIVIIRHLKSSGTSTFNGLADNRSSLIFSMDPANLGKGLSVEVLVVAGGGGGGMDMGGGGGGGGVVSHQNLQVQINSPMPVTVGAGGNGSPGTYGSSPVTGLTGSNSAIGDIIAYGGGGGGSGHYIDVYATNSEGSRGNGGSAGGDSPEWGRNRGMGSDPAPLPSLLQTTQGHSGGAAGCNGDGSYTAGGGGGASRPGQGGRGSWRAGDGGTGFLSAINGTSYYWGGGGGGSGWTNTAGVGGAGGGGGGSCHESGTRGTGGAGINAGANGTAATGAAGGNGGANTGGGGGGGTHAYSVGGNGGSGIVIVRYYGSQQATGGTITSSGGYTIHTFTSSGTFTPTGITGVRDMSISGNGITINGPTFSTAGGGSFQFDGIDDFIDTGFPPFVLANSTLEAWVYDTKNNGSYRAILQNNVDSDDALYVYPNNQLGFWPFGTSGLTVSPNAWHYVAAAYNGSNVLFCVDGQFATVNGTSVDFTDYDFLRIGGYGSADGERWAGYIGPCKVYSKALTQDEMLINFQALRSRYGI